MSKKEFTILALIAMLIALCFYFPEQRVHAGSQTLEQREYEAVSYGPVSDRKDWENYYIQHATFTFINPKWIKENDGKLTTEWLSGKPLFEVNKTADGASFEPKDIEIGLRSDHVVVWRKKEK